MEIKYAVTVAKENQYNYEALEETFFNSLVEAEHYFNKKINKYQTNKKDFNITIYLTKFVIVPEELKDFASYDKKLGYYFNKTIKYETIEPNELLFLQYEEKISELVDNIFEYIYDEDGPSKTKYIFNKHLIPQLKELLNQLEEDSDKICKQLIERNIGKCKENK